MKADEQQWKLPTKLKGMPTVSEAHLQKKTGAVSWPGVCSVKQAAQESLCPGLCTQVCEVRILARWQYPPASTRKTTFPLSPSCFAWWGLASPKQMEKRKSKSNEQGESMRGTVPWGRVLGFWASLLFKLSEASTFACLKKEGKKGREGGIWNELGKERKRRKYKQLF